MTTTVLNGGHRPGPLALLLLVIAATVAFLYSTVPASAGQQCMMVWVPDPQAKPHEPRTHGHYEEVTDLDHDERAVS